MKVGLGVTKIVLSAWVGPLQTKRCAASEVCIGSGIDFQC